MSSQLPETVLTAAAIGVATAAGLACAIAARGAAGHPWTLFAASAWLWAAGASLLLSGQSEGAVAAAVLLAAAGAAALGVTRLPGAPPHASGRGRTAVDGLIVAGGGPPFFFLVRPP